MPSELIELRILYRFGSSDQRAEIEALICDGLSKNDARILLDDLSGQCGEAS